ncbi:nucleoside triphosphate pyrophosphohydrolase [soil metagenome]
MQYNKLVRDKIPAIIMEKDGKVASVSTLSGSALTEALMTKLDEELAEFREAQSEEEMADVLEVLYALAGNTDNDWARIERIRLTKRDERGGFDQGVFLEEVAD